MWVFLNSNVLDPKFSVVQVRFQLSDAEILVIFAIETAQDEIPQCSNFYRHHHQAAHR